MLVDDYCCANHSNMCVHDSDIARITWLLNSCGILVDPNCLCFFPPGYIQINSGLITSTAQRLTFHTGVEGKFNSATRMATSHLATRSPKVILSLLPNHLVFQPVMFSSR